MLKKIMAAAAATIMAVSATSAVVAFAETGIVTQAETKVSVDVTEDDVNTWENGDGTEGKNYQKTFTVEQLEDLLGVSLGDIESINIKGENADFYATYAKVGDTANYPSTEAKKY